MPFAITSHLRTSLSIWVVLLPIALFGTVQWYFAARIFVEGRGATAAVTWIFRGDETRRRSGRDVDIRSRPARASGTPFRARSSCGRGAGRLDRSRRRRDADPRTPPRSQVSYIVIGVEHVATEVEAPFTHDRNSLPLGQMCDMVRANVFEVLERSRNEAAVLSLTAPRPVWHGLCEDELS